MIKIAVCDNDSNITSQIESLLLNLEKEFSTRIEIDIFHNGNNLLKQMEQNTFYDIIYLDISMPEINGIDVASTIRTQNISVLIIYVSAYDTYYKSLFETEPFRFISKPIDESVFKTVFSAAFKRISSQPEYFNFTYNKAFYKLPLKEICYFESKNRIIQIHMNQPKQNENFYDKLNDIEKRLSNFHCNFIRIHQSYLVNLDYVKKICRNKVILFNDEELQISERYQHNILPKLQSEIRKEH